MEYERYDRRGVLDKAIQTVCDEHKDAYGNVEDNFSLIAMLWGDYMQVAITDEDVAMMMCLLKIARTKTGDLKEDNYVDIAGYAACGAEVASSRHPGWRRARKKVQDAYNKSLSKDGMQEGREND